MSLDVGVLAEMFSFLSKLDPRDKLVAASRQTNRQAFIEILCFAEIWIPTANKEKGLDASTATDEQIIDHLENAVRSMDAAEESQPLVYEDNGRRRLPFFSKRKYLQTFAGEYSKKRNMIEAVHFISVEGLVLGGFMEACDEFVLNDSTNTEFCLSERDKHLLGSIWNAARDAGV